MPKYSWLTCAAGKNVWTYHYGSDLLSVECHAVEDLGIVGVIEVRTIPDGGRELAGAIGW